MTRLTIIGNIASGKTTIGKRIQNIFNKDVEFFNEPIDEWFNPFNFVSEIQKNTSIALLSQIHILNTLLKREYNMQLSTNNIKISERSIDSVVSIFCNEYKESKTYVEMFKGWLTKKAKIGKVLNNIFDYEDSEYKEYNDNFEDDSSNLSEIEIQSDSNDIVQYVLKSYIEKEKDYDYVLYIETSPKECLENMIKRKRDGENNNISNMLSYLEKLHYKTLQYVDSIESKGVQVYRLKMDESDNTLKQIINNI